MQPVKGHPTCPEHGVEVLIILGINAFGHDAAAVLLVDGEVAFASAEARFDRERHSPAFPAGAIEACLSAAGVSAGAVDAVAFPWTRGMGRLPKLWHVLRGLPRSRAFWQTPEGAPSLDRRGYLRQMGSLRARLRQGGLRAPLIRVPHHLAHAASAALALPDATGAILTADGMGEWTTAASWTAERGRLRRIERAVYPHSPGKAYTAVTAWLGFRPESGEGKTMGLAAYGNPDTPGYTFARALLAPSDTALLRVRTGQFDFPWGSPRHYGEAFLTALGPPCPASGPPRPGDADVALGIQHAVEAFALSAAKRLLAKTRASALGLAGGLFLNCAMNGRLLRGLSVPVHPFPVAGDSGAAWGAAAEVHRHRTGQPAAPLSTLRLGLQIDPEAAEPLARDGPPRSLEALATEVARRLIKLQVLGVARGRAEFGPRALGGRSVIAWPGSTAIRDDVNARKGREGWRPLAPIVRVGDTRWFREQQLSPWMILTFEASPEARRLVPGIVHADGTARVQTVCPERAPFIHAVLDALEALGQTPVIINTSLNRRGEPIVNTATEALASARAMQLDALVLGDRLIDLSEPGGLPA